MPRIRKLNSKLKANEFYCVQGPTKRVKARWDEMYLEYDRNGKPRVRTESAKCDWTLYKYIKESDITKFEKKGVEWY